MSFAIILSDTVQTNLVSNQYQQAKRQAKKPVFMRVSEGSEIIPIPLLKSYPYCIQQLCIIFILYAVSILRFIFVVKWYKRRFSIASKERR